MTIDQTTVQWMFFAVVLLAAFALSVNYFLVKLLLTGKAAIFERRSDREHAENVLGFNRGA